MKKSVLILSAALSLLAGHAMAATPAAAAATPAPAVAGVAAKPQGLVVKDFKVARDLELERIKVSREQGDILQKCLEGSKVDKDMMGCLTTQRAALTAHFVKLQESGRLEQAYNLPKGPLTTSGAPAK